jgi:hypothetical protein
MHQVELCGSYEQMGRQYAATWKGVEVAFPPPHPKMQRFARECEAVLEQYAPELLVELRALGEEAQVDYDSLLTLSLTAPFEPESVPPPSCTVLAVMPERTKDGRIIVGRNYDFFHDVSEEGATTFLAYPEGAYASLGNCDIWVGREDGINEAGLFVGQAACFLPGLQPGLTFWFSGRMALDRCATVDEALELLTGIPHAASWTYLLADKSGKAAVVEPTIAEVAVRYPEDGLLVMTNHAVCPEWAGKEAFVPPSSHPRYNRLHELLGGDNQIGVEEVKAALRDHEGLVCSHGESFPERKFGTIWSVVARPGEREMHIAAGYPCQSKYHQVSF